MEITEVRVFPVDEEKLKAFASIVIDDAFVVSDIKIIAGKNGRFLSMPSTRRKNGTFRDIAHPLNSQTRRQLERQIFARYDEIMASEERVLEAEVAQEAAARIPTVPHGRSRAPAPELPAARTGDGSFLR